MLYQVTKTRILSTDFTMPMLRELAVRYLGMSDEAVTQTANAKLSKGSQDLKNLSYAKLRTVILTKMDNGFAKANPTWEADGVVELDFECLNPQPEQEPTPEQEPAFGANKGAKATKEPKGKKEPAFKGAVPRKGKYKVANKPASPSVTGNDAEKWKIWQHVWDCTSFEEYFAKAPAKGQKATGSMISASGEMSYALKMGWIVPVE